MKASHWAAAALLLVIVAVVVAGRLLSGADSEGQGAIAPGVERRPLSSSQVPTLPVNGVVEPAPTVGTDAPLPPLPESTVDAGVTMQQALAKGDTAAPPVVREGPREAPSAAELADPKAYQRYEARQNQRLYNQYLKAADSEIPRVPADIERARAAGLTPEQLAEGEEKLRPIQAMRDQLQAEKGATPAP